jgi:hypothetical protein
MSSKLEDIKSFILDKYPTFQKGFANVSIPNGKNIVIDEYEQEYAGISDTNGNHFYIRSTKNSNYTGVKRGARIAFYKKITPCRIVAVHEDANEDDVLKILVNAISRLGHTVLKSDIDKTRVFKEETGTDITDKQFTIVAVDFDTIEVTNGINCTIDPCDCPPSGSTGCVPLHEVGLLDMINGASLSGIGTTTITLVVRGTTFINNIPGSNAERLYYVDFGDGDASTYDITVPINHQLHDMSDGVYKGIITSNYGAKLEFEYQIVHSTIASFCSIDNLSIDYGDLDCKDTFHYPMAVSHDITGRNEDFTYMSFANTDGDVLFDRNYSGASNASESYTVHIVEASNHFNISINAGGTIENIIVLNLKPL